MKDNTLMKKKRILFLSWRDIKAPRAGGAEVHTHELMKVIDKEKYDIISFTPRYEGLKKEEIIDGIKYIRKGNVVTVIFWSFLYYFRYRKDIGYVVEQCNTHRFFTRFWVADNKRVFYIHQLTREIWDVNLSFPLNYIGKRLETWALKLQKKDYVFTVSESTKRDLIDVGFDPKRVFIIPNALDEKFLGKAIENDINEKFHNFVYVGRYSRYKGIDVSIEALGIVRNKYSDARLRIVGKIDETVVRDLIKPLSEKYGLRYGMDVGNDIILCGFVSEESKYQIIKDSLALLFPSIREGWGIIVTEAGAVGTPSIVFDSPGCRDAVDYGRAGFMCDENTAESLAQYMIKCIEDKSEYLIKRMAAYEFAQKFSWKNNKIIINDVLRTIESRG